ncbi:MAG: N-acetylglucosamine-6-phosphate deacetylase [Candidatus Malacoplasma girerdii]|nr:MAG: N-acetylglucosamine-6-phosphate deacetylase [Candidatus Malacoplasma girerdii]
MIIKNVQVANYDEFIENANVYIENDKIVKVERLPGKGNKLVIPGLIDVHIHGFANNDCMDGKTAVEMISKKLAEKGTTAFMPTVMTSEWDHILASLTNVATASFSGAKNIGIHLEGPFFGPKRRGAHKLECLCEATKEKIDQILTAAKGQLRKVTIDPSMMTDDLISYLVSNNVIGMLGHTVCNYKRAMDAYNAGANTTCHLWNAMSGVDSRVPGLLQAALMRENTYVEIIIDLHHVCYESLLFTFKNKNIDHIMCVSDAIRPAAAPDGDNVSGGMQVEKHGLSIFIKGTQTIAGSGICLYDSLKILRSKFSFNWCDIVKLTSYNASRNCNLVNMAQIRPNYYADLLVIDPNNLELLEVYVNGKKVGEN